MRLSETENKMKVKKTSQSVHLSDPRLFNGIVHSRYIKMYICF